MKTMSRRTKRKGGRGGGGGVPNQDFITSVPLTRRLGKKGNKRRSKQWVNQFRPLPRGTLRPAHPGHWDRCNGGAQKKHHGQPRVGGKHIRPNGEATGLWACPRLRPSQKRGGANLGPGWGTGAEEKRGAYCQQEIPPNEKTGGLGLMGETRSDKEGGGGTQNPGFGAGGNTTQLTWARMGREPRP